MVVSPFFLDKTMSPTGSKNAPEAKARGKIDHLLSQAGWLVQYRDDMNLSAGDGIAVCEFKLEKGHGYVDYLLFVDGQAVGVIEAKAAGYSFTSVVLLYSTLAFIALYSRHPESTFRGYPLNRPVACGRS
jgi:hypothetical protein